MYLRNTCITQCKGSALIIVLWISFVLFLAAVFVIKSSREMIFSSEITMDKLQAQLDAESVVEIIKFYGSTGRFSFNYIQNPYLKKEDVPNKIYIDGREIKLPLGKIKMYDTGGLMNVWYLNPEYVKRFLEAGGVNYKVAAIIKNSILDWYDSDDLSRLNGAEEYYYQFEAGAKYKPRNSPAVQSTDELHLIRGLTDEKNWQKIKNYLYLAPHSNLNINAMDKLMLQAVFGLTKDETANIIFLRKTKGFITLHDIGRLTGRNMDLYFDTVSNFPSLVIKLNVESKYKEAREVLTALIDFKADIKMPYKVLEFNY